jgi:hypothetical protein
MDESLLSLRRLTYALFVELGRAPTVFETVARAAIPSEDVLSGWRELHKQHALVLDAAALEIRMANPFSAIPTRFRVEAAGRWWYANCAWDAFGVCAALQVDGRIESTCLDCGEAIAVSAVGRRPDRNDLVFHCLVPAWRWWDDIVFT